MSIEDDIRDAADKATDAMLEARKTAEEFTNGQRGRQIIAQALHYAIKVLEQVPYDYREVSNINDMKYLRTHVFDFPIHLLATAYPSIEEWDGMIEFPKQPSNEEMIKLLTAFGEDYSDGSVN